MKRISQIIFSALVAFFLSACAGTNFVRPDDSALTLGKTTLPEVRSTFGKPFREGTATENNETVTVLSYAYASTGGTPVESGVTPARSLALVFWKDLLVSKVFTSSFKEDSSNFDASKRSSIIDGKTTEDEVIKLLGRASGHAIYPEVKEKNDHALIYLFTAVRGSVFDMKSSQKKLSVVVDQSGIVKSVGYAASGMQ